LKLTLRELRSASVLGPLADLLHTGTTLKELIHSSPNRSYEGPGKACSVTYKSFNKSGGAWFVTYQVFGTKSESDPRGWKVRVRFFPEAHVADPLDLDVDVSCDCPAFLYWGAQWNTHQKDALERQRPELVAPHPVGVEFIDKRGNPRKHNVPRDYVICKHIKAVSERVGGLLERHLKKHTEDSDFQDKIYQQSLEKVKAKSSPEPTQS